MRGLLLKDWYIIIKQAKWLLLLAVMYLIFPMVSESSGFFGAFSILFCTMLPITCMGFDEKSKWDKLALTMPYSRKEIVLSKYVLSLIGCAVSTVLFMITYSIGKFIRTGFIDFSIINIALMFCASSLIFISINLPIMFKAGVEKGRLIFILIAVLFGGTIGALGTINTTELAGFVINGATLITVMIISAVILISSITMSIKVYNNKDVN